MNKTVVIVLAVMVVIVAAWMSMRGGDEAAGPVSTTPTPTLSVSPTVSLTPVISASPSPATGPTKIPTSTPIPTQQSNTIIYTDSGYLPSTVTIKKGQTVTWKNQSSSSMWTASAVHPTHRIYSGTDITACGTQTLIPMFDACEGMASGQSWSFKFDNVGTWNYHNHSHPSHTGTIVVK